MVVAFAAIGVAARGLRAEPPRPTVLARCAKARCGALQPPAGPVHLVVQLDHPPHHVPAVRTANGALRAMRPCRDVQTYCADTDLSGAISIVIDGNPVPLVRTALPGIAVPWPGEPLAATRLVIGGEDIAARRTIHELNGEVVPDVERPPARNPLEAVTEEVIAQLGTPPGPPPLTLNGPVVPGPGPTPPRTRINDDADATDDYSFEDVVGIGSAAGLHCTGVAIAPRWILTARHCGAASRALLGSYAATPADEVAIERSVAPDDPAIDAELLRTARPVRVVRPRRHAADRAAPETELQVIGFGISNFHADTGIGVKRAFQMTVNSWGCDGTRPTSTGCVAGRELVLPLDAAHDTCNGDSGGAVLERIDDSWRLIAITSRAAGRDAACGRGGIYLRIDAIADWIDDVTEDHP